MWQVCCSQNARAAILFEALPSVGLSRKIGRLCVKNSGPLPPIAATRRPPINLQAISMSCKGENRDRASILIPHCTFLAAEAGSGLVRRNSMPGLGRTSWRSNLGLRHEEQTVQLGEVQRGLAAPSHGRPHAVAGDLSGQHRYQLAHEPKAERTSMAGNGETCTDGLHNTANRHSGNQTIGSKGPFTDHSLPSTRTPRTKSLYAVDEVGVSSA